MKKLNFLSLMFLGLLFAFSFLSVKAQNDAPLNNSSKQQTAGEKRPKLLEQLDLTREQIQQIRRINAERKPLLRQAQQRLREANRNLDEAIYADDVKEADIQVRVKEAQAAQAEVIKIRSLNELAVRRILTAEQITKFRGFREQFMQRMNDRKNQKRNNRLKNFQNRPLSAPNKRLNNRQGLPRSAN